jgi:hypothetical protein
MATSDSKNYTSCGMKPSHTMQKKFHDILNYAMYIEMSMLEEWRRTKASTVTLTTSTLPFFETLNPFHFWFHIHVIDYLNSCFDHFITLFSNLNRLTMGAEVEFVYNILSFVRNCISIKKNKSKKKLWHGKYPTYEQPQHKKKTALGFDTSIHPWSHYSPSSINVTLINVNSLYLLTKSYSPHIAN